MSLVTGAALIISQIPIFCAEALISVLFHQCSWQEKDLCFVIWNHNQLSQWFKLFWFIISFRLHALEKYWQHAKAVINKHKYSIVWILVTVKTAAAVNAAGSASYEMGKRNVLHYWEAGKATAAIFFSQGSLRGKIWMKVKPYYVFHFICRDNLNLLRHNYTVFLDLLWCCLQWNNILSCSLTWDKFAQCYLMTKVKPFTVEAQGLHLQVLHSLFGIFFFFPLNKVKLK